jgi:uncharacterized protein (TIGR00255 family)
MRSMTGFGSATRTRAGLSVSVEARSVNNRFLKINLRSPSLLCSREHELEGMIRERVSRGTVSLSIRVVLAEHPMKIRMNQQAVREYRKLFGKLSRESGITGSPSLELIAGLPGVFEAEELEAVLDAEALALVDETVGLALDRMVRMRKREGANLKRDFQERKITISALVKEIGKRAPEVTKAYMARREDRVRRLLDGLDVDLTEADLMRELAVFAERSDITEELTRLVSHLKEYGHVLKGDGDLGRRLEFLSQEMMREANTIGSKSADVIVSRLCVDLKVEMDRLKEQVQNVE